MSTDNSSDATKPAKTACGGKLKNTNGFPSGVYNGELFFFCSQACLRLFQQFPDEFMAGLIEHPTGDE